MAARILKNQQEGRRRSHSIAERPLQEREIEIRLTRLRNDMVSETQLETNMGRGEIHFKTIFIGESGCGKTALVRRLKQLQFNPAIESTQEKDLHHVPVHINRIQVVLDIWDTAGQERYHSLTDQFFEGSFICVVVYDVTDRRSFQCCRRWIEEYIHGKRRAPPPAANLLKGGRPNMALLGTKSDMEHMRCVSFEEGEELAAEFKICFAEESAVESRGSGELRRMMHYLTANAMKAIQGKRRNSDPNAISIRHHKEVYVPKQSSDNGNKGPQLRVRNTSSMRRHSHQTDGGDDNNGENSCCA